MELSYSKEPKVRDLAKSKPELIIQTINYLYVLLSVKEDNRLNEIEESVLNGLILTSFKNYSLNEIKHAFRLALKGDIDVKLYSKLDAITLSAVMKQYKKHKEKTLKEELNRTKTPIALNEDQKKAIESEFIDLCVSTYLIERKSIKSPNISNELYQVYKYFWKLGKINLTNEEVEMYKELALGYWKQELKEMRLKGSKLKLNTPMPTSRQKVIAACLVLYDKITPAQKY